VVKLLADERNVKLYEMYPREDSFRLKRRAVDRDEVESYGLRTPAGIEFRDIFLDEATNVGERSESPA